jgi:ribose transport system permease protein
MSNAIAPRITPPRFNLEVAARFGLLGALLIVLIGFSIASPTFLTGANIFNVLVNNVALLGIVSLGMTLVVGAGGIDLSVGTSIDLASLGPCCLPVSASCRPLWVASWRLQPSASSTRS